MANMECKPEASTVFRKLSQYPPVIGEDYQSILEKFAVIMYDMSSATDSIDSRAVFPKTGHVTHPSTQHLSFNILSVQHTKRFAYGDKQLLYVKWKPKALRTEVGRSKMTCDKCFGQYFHQFLRVANSLRSVAARLNAVAGKLLSL